jgi:hypothetical protein
MGQFSDSVRRFTKKVEVRSQAAFIATATHAHRSIQEGSVVTGAPGQPVDTGNLRASWQLTFDSRTSARISSNVSYAQHVEDNVRGVTFKNHGPHSVRLTIVGLPRIVAYETQQLGER